MPAKKKTAGRKSADVTFSFPPAKKPRTKGEIARVIAEATQLPRRSVVNVLSGLSSLIGQDLVKLGRFTLPGLAKITVVKKPATKARKGINPFTGEPTVFKAKPARKVVKLRALKGLKSFVA